jgi:hypothetical protein
MALNKWIAALALACLSSSAMAAGGDGIYIVFDAGRSYFRNSCKNPPAPYTSCKDFDFGNRISLGKLVADRTFAEIGYYDSGHSTKKGTGNISETIDSVEWQLSAQRIFPIGNGRLSALAKLGVVHWEATQASASKWISASGNDILLGVGTRFYLNKDNTIRAFYESHKAGNNSMTWQGDVHFFSIGFLHEL